MRRMASLVLVMLIAVGIVAGLKARDRDDDDHGRYRFADDSIVVTRTVYKGTADTLTIGQALPPGCVGGAAGTNVNVPTTTAGVTVSVNVPCGFASDNGEFANDHDSHNVWNNSKTDGSFGITSPIYLDNYSLDGDRLGTLRVPSDQVVTSFSSKSELALNLSVDGKSLTFMGYRGGPGCGGNPVSPTAINLIDVSASNTPAICDPTNAVITSINSTPVVPTAYYRAVVEVDADGHFTYTDGNAYSGDNGRAAIKAGNGDYYMVGNDNSGNLPKKMLTAGIFPIGNELVNATGAETLIPLLAPPVPPNIGMIGRLTNPPLIAGDKAGKETNFRGLTIYNNTVYVTKGSGGNGVNTVYQLGAQGTLPTGTAAALALVPITILPGFPTIAASDPNVADFPFGIFFANATTLYVCDEGDGSFTAPATPGANVADAVTLANGGLQKWVLKNGTWTRLYVIQDGLNIGVQYGVPHYPTSLNPATGGCRNMTGRVDDDGWVTIWAITSTISANGDNGADPDKLVRVTDQLSATTLPLWNDDGDNDGDGYGHHHWGRFETLRTARAGEVFRGVAFAPKDHNRHRDDDDK